MIGRAIAPEPGALRVLVHLREPQREPLAKIPGTEIREARALGRGCEHRVGRERHGRLLAERERGALR